MLKRSNSVLYQFLYAMQIASRLLIIGLTVVLVVTTFAASIGALHWPELSVRWGTQNVPAAGMYGQLLLTALMVTLCVFLFANTQFERQDRSRRVFQIPMEDVRRAYEAALSADRHSVFGLSSEFEDMRKRMDYLRKHPDMSHLEPELLEIAAQMSHQSRELARIYSVEKVDRAKTFLKQRQEEVDQIQDRLALARTTCDALRRSISDIEAGKSRNTTGLSALKNDLRAILPALGYDVDDLRDTNIIPMPTQLFNPTIGPQKQ